MPTLKMCHLSRQRIMYTISVKVKREDIKYDSYGHVWIRDCKHRKLEAPLTSEEEKALAPLTLKVKGNSHLKTKQDLENAKILFDIVDNRRQGFFNILRRPEWQWLVSWAEKKVPKLMHQDKFKPSISTIANWIINGRTDFPRCPVCKHKIQDDVNVSATRAYLSHCSNRCKTLDPAVQSKIRATCKAQDPDASWTSTKKSRAKTAKTCLEKYGVDTPFKAEVCKKKIKQTTFERYGDENYRNNEQRIATNNAKYGQGVNGTAISKALLEHTPEQKAEHLENIRKSKLDRYGDENWNNPEQMMETCRERYGVDYPVLIPEAQEKARRTKFERTGYECNLSDPANREKSKKTWIEKYGVENPMQSDEVKAKIRDTKLKHFGMPCSPSYRYSLDGKSFDSSWEVAFYIWLRDNRPDAEFTHPCDTVFIYNDSNGKSHAYVPDFKVGTDIIEIKGDQFFDERGNLVIPFRRSEKQTLEDYAHQCDCAHHKQECMIANNVKVLRKKDVAKYLAYVEEKYGKNYLASLRSPKREK